MNIKDINNNIKTFTIIFVGIITLLNGCTKEERITLNKHEKMIKIKVKKSGSASSFFTHKDTIALNGINENLFDAAPIIKANLKIIVMFNPLSKNILILNRSGKLLSKIEKDGDGPGEFRFIQCGTLDTNNNIYIYDHVLKRITKYDAKGKYIFSLNVKYNSDNIRKMTCDNNGYIYLFHAPITGNDGFVSIYNNKGFVKFIFDPIKGFEPYYKRGFLDGGIIFSKNDGIFATYIFSYKIAKYSKGVVTYFGKKLPIYKPLKKSRNDNHNILTNNYYKSTIIKSLFIIDNSRILVQEFMNFNPTSKYKMHKNLVFYSISGVYLGVLSMNKYINFNCSDGKYLIQFIPPPFKTYNNINLKAKLIIYKI